MKQGMQGLQPTRDEMKKRYSREDHRQRDKEASLLAKPKEFTPFNKMPIYNPLRDPSWQITMSRIREIDHVGSVSSKKG